MRKDAQPEKWQKTYRSVLSMVLLWIGFSTLAAQSPSRLEIEQVEAVESCIHTFAKAADQQDLEGLQAILHSEYRTVLNKAFGSDEVTVLNKETYISMAKGGKIGGKPRDIKIISLDIQSEVARATVVLESKETRFTSFFSMIRDPKGNWLMVEDLPQIESLN